MSVHEPDAGVRAEQGDSPTEGARWQEVVRGEQDDELAVDASQSVVVRPEVTGVVPVVQHLHPRVSSRQAVCHLPTAVGGRVVHDQHVHLHTLLPQHVSTSREEVAVPVAGDDDGDAPEDLAAGLRRRPQTAAPAPARLSTRHS